MEIKVLPNTNILDAALANGSLEALFALAKLNGKSITDELEAGEILQAANVKFKPSAFGAIPNPDLAKVTVMSGQTMLDLAVQQLGSLEALFALAKLNSMPVTQDLTNGQVIDFSLTPFNRKMVQAYKNNGWKPASGTTSAPAGEPPLPILEGVDYWAIEIDFKVQ